MQNNNLSENNSLPEQNSTAKKNRRNVSERIMQSFDDSCARELFCSAEKTEKAYKSSATSFLFGRVFSSKQTNTDSDNETSRFYPLKKAFSRRVESSTAVNLYRSALERFFTTSSRAYGAFFLSFSLISILILYIRKMVLGTSDGIFPSFLASTLLFVVSIFLITSKKSLGNCIKDSAILSYIFTRLLPLKISADKLKENTAIQITPPLLIGMMFGFSTVFFSFTSILAAFGIIASALIALYSPESVIIATLMCFTFIPKQLLLLLLCGSLISYAIKLLRGKRNFSLRAADCFVLLFVLYSLTTCFTAEEFLARIAISGTYFIIVNLITTKRLVFKCILALAIGALITSAYAIYEYVVSFVSVSDFKNTFISGAAHQSTAALQSADLLGVYLAVVIIISAYCKRLREWDTAPTKTSFLFMMFLLGIAASGSETAFLCLVTGMALYAVLTWKKKVPALMIFFCAAAFTFYRLSMSEIMAETVNSLRTVMSEFNNIFLIGAGTNTSVSDTPVSGILPLLFVQGGIFNVFLFVLAVFLVVQAVISAIHSSYTSQISTLSATLISALLTLILYMCLSPAPASTVIFTLFFALCGLSVSCSRMTETDTLRKTTR